ncbi:creatininase family protein [bacterium]|nr:MAG: creatininase family protein [bacterium]
MLLTHLTWPEVDALDRETPVVVPMAGLVQGGRHLAIGAPLAFTEAVVEKLAEARPNALFLPVVPIGMMERHLSFPGTVAHSFEVIDEVVKGTVESLARHGFRRFLFLVGEGDTIHGVQIACRRLKSKYPTLLLVQNICAVGGSKAGPLETSVSLHLHPHLVRPDLLGDDGLVEPVPGAIRSQDEISETGSFGPATRVDVADGRETFEHRIELGIQAIDAIAADEPMLAWDWSAEV